MVGSKIIEFTINNFPSGVYLYSIEAGKAIIEILKRHNAK